MCNDDNDVLRLENGKLVGVAERDGTLVIYKIKNTEIKTILNIHLQSDGPVKKKSKPLNLLLNTKLKGWLNKKGTKNSLDVGFLCKNLSEKIDKIEYYIDDAKTRGMFIKFKHPLYRLKDDENDIYRYYYKNIAFSGLFSKFQATSGNFQNFSENFII